MRIPKIIKNISAGAIATFIFVGVFPFAPLALADTIGDAGSGGAFAQEGKTANCIATAKENNLINIKDSVVAYNTALSSAQTIRNQSLADAKLLTNYADKKLARKSALYIFNQSKLSAKLAYRTALAGATATLASTSAACKLPTGFGR